MGAKKVAFALLFVYYYLTQNCSAEELPEVYALSQTQFHSIGENVQLSCYVQQLDDYSVIWIKSFSSSGKENKIISIGNLLMFNNLKYSIHINQSKSTHTLQIKNVQENDFGIYDCQINVSSGKTLFAKIELRKVRSPFILDTLAKTIYVSEGEAIALQCYDNPSTTRVLWNRENNATLPEGSATDQQNILKIYKIKRENKGTYSCVTDDGVEDGRNIVVNVEFAPRIKTLQSHVSQARHYNAQLDCRVEANPLSTITWQRNNESLSNNEHYNIEQFAGGAETTYTTLTVISIEEEDYGEYECEAMNRMGKVKGKIQLNAGP